MRALKLVLAGLFAAAMVVAGLFVAATVAVGALLIFPLTRLLGGRASLHVSRGNRGPAPSMPRGDAIDISATEIAADPKPDRLLRP
jgi:hypothetical protein